MTDWPNNGYYKSGRDFRASKRAGIRKVLSACNEFRLGVAFTPCYEKLAKAFDLLKEAQEEMSVKRWKR